jgi:hypothetical protein
VDLKADKSARAEIGLHRYFLVRLSTRASPASSAFTRVANRSSLTFATEGV